MVDLVRNHASGVALCSNFTTPPKQAMPSKKCTVEVNMGSHDSKYVTYKQLKQYLDSRFPGNLDFGLDDTVTPSVWLCRPNRLTITSKQTTDGIFGPLKVLNS
jgi:hypothetical protein